MWWVTRPVVIDPGDWWLMADGFRRDEAKGRFQMCERAERSEA